MDSFRITVEGTGASFACSELTNVLAAMERSHCRDIPVGCRNGGCGACKVRVVSGSFHAAKMNRAVVTAKEEEDGCVLACKIFPRTDLSLQVLGRVWEHAKPPKTTSFSFGFTVTTSIPSQPDKET